MKKTADRPIAADAVATLIEAGMPPAAAQLKPALLEMIAARTTLDNASLLWVPGRVELFGKHTDYAGGHSLVLSTDRGFLAAVKPTASGHLRLTRADNGDTVELPLRPDAEPNPGHWSDYPTSVVRRLTKNFSRQWRGGEIVFASDLPPAAGMSSSSALVILILQAMVRLNDLRSDPAWTDRFADPEALAEYAGTFENGKPFHDLAGDGGVGTFGGSQDHAAILAGRAGHVTRFSFCPLQRIDDLPWPNDHALLIANSGVIAAKTGAVMGKYNRASELVGQLTSLWAAQRGVELPLAQILDSDPGAGETLRQLIDTHADPSDREALVRRLEQFEIEYRQCIPAAAEALRRGDLKAFGEATARSQWAAEHRLGNQVDATCGLVAEAVRLGAVAASAFGAGFGGSVWAMVPAPAAESFLVDWEAAYTEAFPEWRENCCFFETSCSPPAMWLC